MLILQKSGVVLLIADKADLQTGGYYQKERGTLRDAKKVKT